MSKFGYRKSIIILLATLICMGLLGWYLLQPPNAGETVLHISGFKTNKPVIKIELSSKARRLPDIPTGVKFCGMASLSTGKRATCFQGGDGNIYLLQYESIFPLSIRLGCSPSVVMYRIDKTGEQEINKAIEISDKLADEMNKLPLIEY